MSALSTTTIAPQFREHDEKSDETIDPAAYDLAAESYNRGFDAGERASVEKSNPLQPSRLTVEAEHLIITGTFDSGHEHNLHLVQDHDLSVKLQRGCTDGTGQNAKGGLVMVALDVDQDHDEVLVDTYASVGIEESIGRAIEALMMASNALRDMRRMGGDQ
jgi:hypothetical protein